MSRAILVLNAGSSSIKFSLFLEQGESLEFFLGGQLEGLYTSTRFKAKQAQGLLMRENDWPQGLPLGHDGAIAYLADFLREELGQHSLVAVGHRVVHGGLDFAAPLRLNAETVERLEKLNPLAPLHQPHNLKPIRLLLDRLPDLPQVACFDTAFHRTQPELAQMFALPKDLHDEGVRRYGFHGLSYEYIASALPALDPAAAQGRCVVLHLGNGASMCAISGGNSVASTMGFTALDGLPMGTRCGALDPGVILYLIDQHGLDARAIEDLLYKQSGLLGVSGLSSDMRTLLASEEPRAKLAVDLYVYRIVRELGSLAAALGGLDALVFTGGIGENSAEIRARVCRAVAWLGLELNESANQSGLARISAPASKLSAWKIPTDEELMIARHTRRLLAE
ncbi:acetate/propionate family kinase [Roseateles oligotrophus]|uniref:Acetate kinase n=1 Tax=Roseateles oligotrophus TaxID=1769250 RepID=A0ABT2YGV7_9BURK|nr:acetate/propionate family kinase [Roseateles oligotrophus]MCV2369220.1 acetate/propionate family kinase [Roseateles oligotrophus]